MMASGYFGVGDIRDTVASLVRLDAVDTLLNALATVPAVGDALKAGNIVDKVVTFAKYPNYATVGPLAIASLVAQDDGFALFP